MGGWDTGVCYPDTGCWDTGQKQKETWPGYHVSSKQTAVALDFRWAATAVAAVITVISIVT